MSDSIRRRDFVRCSVAVALVLPALPMLGACASVMTRTVRAVDGTLRLALTHYPELTAAGGSLRVLPEGSGDPVYIFREAHNQYSALSSICTHLQCTVEIKGARLICPCHGSTYDRGGKVLEGPAEQPLTAFRWELMQDGVLIVHLRSGAES